MTNDDTHSKDHITNRAYTNWFKTRERGEAVLRKIIEKCALKDEFWTPPTLPWNP